MNFGPTGAGINGYFGGQGIYGNGKVIAETCKQCPHPVPCAEACPQGAIKAHPVTGARKIDTARVRRLRHLHRGVPVGHAHAQRRDQQVERSASCVTASPSARARARPAR